MPSAASQTGASGTGQGGGGCGGGAGGGCGGGGMHLDLNNPRHDWKHVFHTARDHVKLKYESSQERIKRLLLMLHIMVLIRKTQGM